MSINLRIGKTTTWCDPDHRPRCPVDVVVADAEVMVADSTLRTVLVYDDNGRFIESLSPGDGAQGRFRPTAVAWDGDVLYVANMQQRQIERFQTHSRSWLTPLRPDGSEVPLIAPAGLTLSPDGVLFVADAIGGRIQRVDARGTWLEPIGSPGRGEGQLVRPKQLCLAGDLLLVCDAGRQSVVVVDRHEGRFVTEIHERGDQWQGWTLPMGMLAVPAATWSGTQEDDEYDAVVLVSDSLGGESLTLMQVFDAASEGSDEER